MAREITYRNETAVKKRIKTILDKHDWFHWAVPANGMGQSGISDRMAFKNNIFIAIEAKFGKNPLSALQRAFLRSIAQEGGYAFVVNDSNVEWLDTFCENFNAATVRASKNEKPTDEQGIDMLNAIDQLTKLL